MAPLTDLIVVAFATLQAVAPAPVPVLSKGQFVELRLVEGKWTITSMR